MVIFSAVAIWLTSLWNKGFIIKSDPTVYFKAALIIAAVFYLIIPVSRLILLPLNILTLGLVSVLFYAAIFYLLLNRFHVIAIEPWVTPPVNWLGISIAKMSVSGLSNIFVSSFSISTIINLLETML